jgi:hypothetical protein
MPCFRVVFWHWSCSVDRGQQPCCGPKDEMLRGSQVDQRVVQASTVDSVLNHGRRAAQVSGRWYSLGADTRIGYMARRIVSSM